MSDPPVTKPRCQGDTRVPGTVDNFFIIHYDKYSQKQGHCPTDTFAWAAMQNRREIEWEHSDREKRMLTPCLFVNKMDKPITELHGVLRLRFREEREAQIAKTTVNFDEAFLGTLHPDEALLVHFHIPVKGLSKDESFRIADISGSFEDVRVTQYECRKDAAE